MLLKVIIVKNIWFVAISILIMGLNFKYLLAMVVNELLMLCLNNSNITIINVKDIDYHCVICNISTPGAINFLQSSMLDDRDTYKIYFKEINNKNIVCKYFSTICSKQKYWKQRIF